MSREQDTVAPAIDRDTAETGRMRLRGVVDEAWRDIVSGTSHAFMLMLILSRVGRRVVCCRPVQHSVNSAAG